jgi:putative phosphoribosyl transferase
MPSVRPRTSPRNAGAARTVPIAADDAVLAGELTLPLNPRGLVLFAHGSGSSRFSRRNQHVAATLHAAGLGTLLFDLLTEAEEARDVVTAEHRFNIELLVERLVAATDWAVSGPTTTGLPLGYFGASTGAAAALGAAAQRRDVIRAVVSRGGRPDLAGKALHQVNAPTLLIVGEHDPVVLNLNRHAKAMMVADCEIVIVPGATHLFEEYGALERVAGLASEWFARHL